MSESDFTFKMVVRKILLWKYSVLLLIFVGFLQYYCDAQKDVEDKIRKLHEELEELETSVAKSHTEKEPGGKGPLLSQNVNGSGSDEKGKAEESLPSTPPAKPKIPVKHKESEEGEKAKIRRDESEQEEQEHVKKEAVEKAQAAARNTQSKSETPIPESDSESATAPLNAKSSELEKVKQSNELSDSQKKALESGTSANESEVPQKKAKSESAKISKKSLPPSKEVATEEEVTEKVKKEDTKPAPESKLLAPKQPSDTVTAQKVPKPSTSFMCTPQNGGAPSAKEPAVKENAYSQLAIKNGKDKSTVPPNNNFGLQSTVALVALVASVIAVVVCAGKIFSMS